MSGFAYRVDGASTSIPLDEAPAASGALVWVHLCTNEQDAQDWLRDKAGLPGFIVDALTATETRPRCEPMEGGAFINLRGPSSDAMTTSDPLASVRIWAQQGRVWSVTRKTLNAVARVTEAVERGEVSDPGDLIATFAASITEELDPLVADLGDSLDQCEESLDSSRIFELRRLVTQVRVASINYRRFLNPQRGAVERLATLPADWLEPDDRVKLSAAADRAARMAEELEAIRERSALMHEALTDLRAEQIDSRALIISVVAMVFLPLTFITGLLGMNVQGIPYADRPWAFDGVVAFCAVLAAAVTIFFLRRHWFR